MDIELLLWLPIILLALASIIKMLTASNSSNRKPWIRIEEIKENE
jgi:hypothetical protein|tara:strand:+ start:537 stop:671 length:135 start_codon:yes stop_codon:yes gene_type:complete